MCTQERPWYIAHSGRFVCIPNCVGEFEMGTEQPLVTSNVVSNHLSNHHKAYYTYIEMYTQKYRCHWGEFLISNKMYYACYQKDCTTTRSVSVHLYLRYDATCGH